MHYLDEGRGPVVVLLHGNPTWCFYYRNLIRELRQYFRVIAPDHIGCGLSDHPQDAHFRAIDRVGHLAELLRQLGIERCSLVMHDWGGPIGTGFAVRNVGMIEKLVYLNTTLTETESLPLVIKTAATPVIGKWITKSSKRFIKLTTNWGVARKLPRQIKEGYYFPYHGAKRRTALWDFVADIPFDSSHPSYSEMILMADKLPQLGHVPVQIVWGLQDPCFHREMLNKVAQHFPQASIREIPDASHLVLEDAPQQCIETIRTFLLSPVPVDRSKLGETPSQNPFVSAVREWATAQPSQDAVIEPQFFPDTVRYTHFNYRELVNLVHKYARGLADLGLRSGDRVLMLVPAGVDFLALSYAVMDRGGIPIFLDPGMGRENLLRCIADANPQAFIGSPKAHLLRYLKSSVFAGLKFSVCVSDWLTLGTARTSTLKKYSAQPLAPVALPETALVAFTSGGTGAPKGVPFTHEMVKSQLGIFKNVFGLGSPQKDLPLLPIFSLFGVAAGVCSVFPPMDTAKPLSLNPEKIVKVIQDIGISVSFGSPTLWHKIAEYCVRTRTQLQSLRRIFMAGAAVPVSTLQRVKEIAPAAEAYTPYGATEALPVTLISSEEILSTQPFPAKSGEQGTIVGKAVPGVQIRIAIVSDEVKGGGEDIVQFLGTGQIGEILVAGANVASSYLNRSDATRASKIMYEGQLWHRMGDVGYLDPNGNLYFCGRKMHMVACRERVYCSEPVERIFNQHEKVRRSALVALKRGTELAPALVVEPHPQFWPSSADKKEELRSELLHLAKSTDLTAAIEKIYFHPSFPVDARHNAKIFRDRLGDWVNTGKIDGA
ncbi:MAG: alpha/beta fold hydrolase [Oligoflexia bacterium]|nr:alpha/beta fold hydrolase [Oligoflexia bacterium]